MYIAELRVENFRCFGSGDRALDLQLRPGLTALVGENDVGKTAVIDALRYLLGTRDEEYIRIRADDFHRPLGSQQSCREISIRCRFEGLTATDKSAFAEHLTYARSSGQSSVTLYVNWTARAVEGETNPRRSIKWQVASGKNSDGPYIDTEARKLLRATYLRPLRDANSALSAGRGSRLSQILQHTTEITTEGRNFDPAAAIDVDTLSVLGVGDYATSLLRNRKGVRMARDRLNKDYLSAVSLRGAQLLADIGVSQSKDAHTRLRQLLEKLELDLVDARTLEPLLYPGLGSNNALFMACEMLLLGTQDVGFPLLLIEEPEAHLHPQRQLRLMQFLQRQVQTHRDDGQQIQVLVTTHSPNLASAIELNNIILLNQRRAFPLTEGKTGLERSDYRFLERFLDVTKANLFFARGVVIVEGDAENLLIPALARLLGRDFCEYGVSVVNVGGTGLRRYARIFQRADVESDGEVETPVACIADMDVWPDFAPAILGYARDGEALPNRAARRWRIDSDFGTGDLERRRRKIQARATGQRVRTFVADYSTLEYDLSVAGLARDVWIAAHLARQEPMANASERNKVEQDAGARFEALPVGSEEEIACHVYSLFTTGARASKAIAAQYLVSRLDDHFANADLNAATLRARLPKYLTGAIDYVTNREDQNDPISGMP